MGDSFKISVAKPKHEDELQELEKGTQTWDAVNIFKKSTENKFTYSHLNSHILPLKDFTYYNENYWFIHIISND